jgi:pimeloyl-ACP methyl ester carboxylesterase
LISAVVCLAVSGSSFAQEPKSPVQSELEGALEWVTETRAGDDSTQATATASTRVTTSPPVTAVVADSLELEGGNIHYEVFGDGFPVVMIHDGLAHSEIWDAQVSAFARSYKVVRYDRRGYGRSPQPEAPYSNVEDLQALVGALEIDKAVFMGSSSGGGLAIDYALEHPERVEALILSGPVVNGLGYSYHFMKRNYGNFDMDRTTTIDLWANDPYAVAPENDAARARLRKLLHENPHNLDFAKHGLHQKPERAALDRLHEIIVPTLIITGDRDIADVHAHVGAIEAGIAGARRVVVGGAGHLPYFERPDDFNHQVREFFSLLSLEPDSPRATADPEPPWDTYENGFVPVNGTSLYFEVMGEGDLVVLLHGGAIDHRMWDDQFATLAARYRVVRYDARGHGLSLSPYGAYAHYEDLRMLLSEFGGEPAHLIGLSMGCRMAVDLAIAHPELVGSLVLCSPGVSGYEFNSPEEQEYLERIRAAWMSADFAQAAEEFLQAWADGPHRTPNEMPVAVRLKVKRMALATVRPDRDMGQGVELDPPASGRLEEIQAPTLAILGELDMPGIHEIVRRIGEEVRGARVEHVDGVAHMVNMERASAFNRMTMEFLDEVGKR